MLDLSKTNVVKRGVLLDRGGDEYTVLIVEREILPLKSKKTQAAQGATVCYFAWADSPARPEVFLNGWGPFPSLSVAMEKVEHEHMFSHWDD